MLAMIPKARKTSGKRMPFTPKTADNDKLVLQHERLRQVENPTCRWMACYAGAPVGKPARVRKLMMPD